MVGVLLIPTARKVGPSLRAIAALGVVCAGVCVSACGGKGAEGSTPNCPALDNCGGDPTGNWQILEACQYLPVRPTQPTDVNDFMGTPPLPPTLAPPQPQATQLAQTTSGDWCSALNYNMGTVNNVTLWHDVPKIGPGTMVTFLPNNTYQAVYLFSTNYAGARNSTHFAPICLTANGANPSPSCADLTAGLTKFYSAGNPVPPIPGAPAAPAPPPTFGNIQCMTSPSDQGCDCTYVYGLQVVDQGTWSSSVTAAASGALPGASPPPGTIFEENSSFTYNGQVSKLGTPAQTVRVTYCQRPGTTTLELSGDQGGSLSDLPGLRTMLLQKM